MTKILISYGTTEGQTARITEYIADVMRSQGHAADVTPAGWSGSSESLAAHDVGQEGLIHDDDEETTHSGAGGP